MEEKFEKLKTKYNATMIFCSKFSIKHLMFVERFLKQATYHKIILLSNCWEILNCNRISDKTN